MWDRVAESSIVMAALYKVDLSSGSRIWRLSEGGSRETELRRRRRRGSNPVKEGTHIPALSFNLTIASHDHEASDAS
jgi:hypothetical protein